MWKSVKTRWMMQNVFHTYTYTLIKYIITNNLHFTHTQRDTYIHTHKLTHLNIHIPQEMHLHTNKWINTKKNTRRYIDSFTHKNTCRKRVCVRQWREKESCGHLIIKKFWSEKKINKKYSTYTLTLTYIHIHTHIPTDNF